MARIPPLNRYQSAKLAQVVISTERQRAAAHAMAEATALETGKYIMIILAQYPYADWPDIAKKAFEHTQRRAPQCAQAYLETLPTVNPFKKA